MRVLALSQVQHDGETYPEGTSFLIDDTAGEILVNDGVVEKESGEQSSEKKEKKADVYQMSKPDLNNFATSLGIDPKAFGSRSDLIEAINKVQSGAIAGEQSSEKTN